MEYDRQKRGIPTSIMIPEFIYVVVRRTKTTNESGKQIQKYSTKQ